MLYLVKPQLLKAQGGDTEEGLELSPHDKHAPFTKRHAVVTEAFGCTHENPCFSMRTEIKCLP